MQRWMDETGRRPVSIVEALHGYKKDWACFDEATWWKTSVEMEDGPSTVTAAEFLANVKYETAGEI